jgi:hypothetical protein
MISTEPRKFHEVVADLRQVVFSVIRDRPKPTGGIESAALGTGFFVRADIFISCEHVLNPPGAPHQPGDSYRLIANLSGNDATVHVVTSPQVGKELSLFPQSDLAVLQVANVPDQDFASVCYGDVLVGHEIGVVGYPLATLGTDASGNLLLDGLIYRAGRGVITGRFQGDITTAAKNIPLLEVNFMFVSGNSGGPVFDPETGRVLGMVQGVQWIKIAEQIVKMNPAPNQQLPLGGTPAYIAPLIAVYSRAVKLDCFKTVLDGFGVVA